MGPLHTLDNTEELEKVQRRAARFLNKIYSAERSV